MALLVSIVRSAVSGLTVSGRWRPVSFRNFYDKSATAPKSLTTRHEFFCQMSTSAQLPTGLSAERRLPLSGETVLVERLDEGQVEEAFQLVKAAAQRGDNVGVAEISSTMDLRRIVSGLSHAFGAALAVRSSDSRVLDALLFVGPCPYARTIRPNLASIQVVTSVRFSVESTWVDCVELAMETVGRLGAGYSACLMPVFAVCINRILILRRLGFSICAGVPFAGRLARSPVENGDTRISPELLVESEGQGHRAPLVSSHEQADRLKFYSHSYLMYKELAPFSDERPSVDEMIQHSATLLSEPEVIHSLPSILCLPAEYIIGRNRIPVVVRPLRLDEMERYYEYFRSEAETEEGFSVEEFPTQTFFWRIFRSCYNMVIERKVTDKRDDRISGDRFGDDGKEDWIGVMCFSDSLFSRDKNCVLYDATVVVSEGYRSFGLGSDLIEVVIDLGRRLGYAAMFTDTPIHHLHALVASYRNNNLTFSGTLPRAIYSRKHGWCDVILLSSVPQLNREA